MIFLIYFLPDQQQLHMLRTQSHADVNTVSGALNTHNQGTKHKSQSFHISVVPVNTKLTVSILKWPIMS